MGALITAGGAVLVAVALRDIFHTLFHPSGRGSLARLVSHATWRLARAVATLAPRALTLAGPLVVLAVIATWLALLVVGWTLIYLPWLPESFLLASGLAPGAQGGIGDALYLSLVTVATLGYGDIVPTEAWLRAVAPLQALLGFGLLTAAITWVLSIYPALSRLRSLSQSVVAFDATLARHGVALADLEPAMLAQILQGLEERLAAVHVDLVQFPTTYYFNSREESLSLAECLPRLRRLAREAAALPAPEARVAAAWLERSLTELVATVGRQFLSREDADFDEVLTAYRREHRAERAR